MIALVSPTEMVKAALFYAQRGWPIFPCKGKKPLTPHGFHHASTDLKQIERWWGWWPDANIGLPTGDSSGVLVLDVDFPRGGLSSLRALSLRVGRLPRTCVSRTGCGWHLFYHAPPVRVASSTNLGGAGAYPGLDLKAQGGYVIVPPSVHEAMGRAYHWIGISPLLPCPKALLDLLTTHHKSGGALDAAHLAPASTQKGLQGDRALLWAIAHAHPGNRNDLGYWLACRLVEAGVSEAEASRLLRAYVRAVGSSGSHAYMEQEALRSLRSAMR